MKMALSRSFIVLVLLGIFPAIAEAGLLLTGSFEGRFEQGLDQNTDILPFTDAAIEYHWQSFYFGVEAFQNAVQNSGNASLSLSSQTQGGWLTTAYEAGDWQIGSPYFRVGLGGYHDTVTTTLLGVASTNVSRTYMTGFGGVGMRFDTYKALFASVETRLIFGENQIPQPAFAVLVRIGLEFGGRSYSRTKPSSPSLE